MFYDLKIYDCYHVYWEANKAADCVTKKVIGIIDSIIWKSNFSKDVSNFSFEDYYDSSFNRFWLFAKFLFLSLLPFGELTRDEGP